MKKNTLLGKTTPQQFFRDYWHKKPLLVRNAVPEFKAILPRDALFQLASRDDVESRLISHFDKRWQIKHGPFTKFPPLSKKKWTLLIQGANLYDDVADALLQRFRFIPDARLDDLMISYATDGGGVGPHFDSYDVFLLQAHGQRRWRIGAQQDLSVIEGLPLKILQHFQPEQEFVLDPGDMLYLPPHYAHEGVAIGECMTYSIGFRAPSYQELGEAFLEFMADSIDLPGRYTDPDLQVSARPAEISTTMVDRVATELSKAQFTKDDILVFLGEYLSEPKPTVFFHIPEKKLGVERFLQQAEKKGLALSNRSRMLYRGKHIFINGESFVLRRPDAKTLMILADARSLDGDTVSNAPNDVKEALHIWYQAGWLRFRES